LIVRKRRPDPVVFVVGVRGAAGEAVQAGDQPPPKWTMAA
jgi:hypothetical protein